MKFDKLSLGLASALACAVLAGPAFAQGKTVLGSTCTAPPRVDCPEANCNRDLLANPGEATDPKTGRKYFLDFPCDLKPDEKVVFILSLHGGGSIGNWQRHYFPAVDHKEKHRLVIATPSGKARAWVAADDDQHLQNVVEAVFAAFGKQNIKSFWLAGHSQGGMTSNRIVCTPFFKDKVDGWLSLSGGRIGRAKVPASFGAPRPAQPGATPPAAPPPAVSGAPGPGAAATPDCDMHFIFTSGELEIEGLPETSPWADKYGCAARVRRTDIVDAKPGYVTATDQSRGPAWGRHARPGTAQVFVYPSCREGKVVADVVRLNKGHTEGLEPKVTEELLKMIVAAPGGKAQTAS
jgi:hypothetical protein